MIKLLAYVNHLILLYFMFSVFVYSILLIGSFFTIINAFNRERRSSISTLLDSKNLPPVTAIVPIYNEQENIINVVESILKSTYKNLFIIIVNDCSKDNTMRILEDTYDLMSVPIIIEDKLKTSPIKQVLISKIHSNLMIIDKLENNGRSDSLNIGVNACFTPYFTTIDGDSLIAPTAIAEFIYDMLTEPKAIAVGGGVYIINACEYANGVMKKSLLPKKIVPGIQAVEYMRSHLFGRTGWNLYGGTMAYSGTATLYDRKIVVESGGFDVQNFAQDVEIIMRINAYMHKHNRPYKILFNPAVAIWTDVPNDLKSFAKQRDLWRRGMLRSTLKYWFMFLNPKYGIQGILGYPFYVLLEILAPIIEFTAYFSVAIAYFLGALNAEATLLFIILAWGFISYITIANMFINIITFNRYKQPSDIYRVFVFAILETFGFRQYNVLVNMYGTIHYFVNRLRGKAL